MQGLKLCNVMIVVISPNAMHSRNVEDEWQYFLDKNKPVIPVLLRPAEIHFQLNRVQRIDFYNEDYDTALQYLFLELEHKNIDLDTGAIVARPTIIGRRPVSNSRRKKIRRPSNIPLFLIRGFFALIITFSMAFVILNWREQIMASSMQNPALATLNATEHFETIIALEHPVSQKTSVPESVTAVMNLIADESVNVRSLDDPTSARIDFLTPGQRAKALGTNHFKTWYYVEFINQNSGAVKRGWVSAPFVTLTVAESTLPELTVKSAAALP